MDTARDMVLKNKAKQHDHYQQFRDIFKVELARYMHPLFGFDIIAFDEQVVKPNDNESCRQAIVREYGQEAANLVEALLK